MVHALWTSAMMLAADPAPAQPGAGPDWLKPLMLVSFFLALFWLIMIRPQQKEQAKRRQMLDALKKNDRVLTVGGIYGVVTNVNTKADEITLRVDEANNTKLRVTLGAISRVLTEETPADSDSASS